MLSMLGSCDRSQPSSSEIQQYVENYQIAHDYSVSSISYEVTPSEGDRPGRIRVSGKLELLEPLYIEDIGNKQFRKDVAKMLRRNRFSEREIKHEIYDRIIRAAARVPNSENQYYTFLKQKHAPGYAINFSADLVYKRGNNGFMIDGPVRHPKLVGARLIKFSNPIVENAGLVQKAVKGVLAEQTRYRDMMKDNSAVLSRLWDNDFGLVVWNRKVPYLGNENLSRAERVQLKQFADWRAVYRISNIKPVQYRTPHASNFFELGSYTTQGVATCLRQVGFIDELRYSKSNFDQYCEFGKQYPARIELSSVLNDTNEFVASVRFEVNGVNSGQMAFGSDYFEREQNELGRYSDQQRVVLLDGPFNVKAHSRPVFTLVPGAPNESDLLSLKYLEATDYQLARFERADPGPHDSSAASIVTGSEKQQQSPVPAVSDASSVIYEADEVAQEVPQAVSQIDNKTDDSDTIDGNVDDIEPTVVAAAATVGVVAKAINSESTKGQIANEAADTKTNAPLTKKELVKAIQRELKRLKIYNSSIDGIAGENTFRSMNHAQSELGKGNFTKPSQEFLTVLKQTKVGEISPLPTKTSKPAAKSVAKVEKPKKQKKTIAGNALRWAGGLFSNKDRKKKSKKKN